MTSPVRIFRVSDLHFGREDRAALDWFAEDVARECPDAVVCTGDLTWRGTSREFAAAQEWFSALGVPVSVEPGNHDMPYYWDPLRRLAGPYRRFRVLREAVHSELSLNHVRVVPLKTVARAQLRLNQSKGRVSSQALSETVAELHEAGDKPLRLVACHHPLVDAGTHSSGSTRGGRQALAALAHAGADAVLSGHVHDPFDLNVEAGGHRIRLIGAGTLSARLRKSPPGYNLLEWTAETGLAVTVRHRG